MATRHMSALAFLFLAACPDVFVPAPRPHEPPPKPLLQAGVYDFVVEDVVADSCGIPRGELVGQSIPGELRVGREEVVFEVGGWVLRGEMEPGSLYVEGRESIVYDVEEDCVDVDYDDEERPDADGEERPEAGDDEGYEEPEGREPPREDCGDDEPAPPPEELFASLDARILDSRHADGRFEMEMPGCALVVAVRLEPAVERPEEEEPCGKPPRDDRGDEPRDDRDDDRDDGRDDGRGDEPRDDRGDDRGESDCG